MKRFAVMCVALAACKAPAVPSSPSPSRSEVKREAAAGSTTQQGASPDILSTSKVAARLRLEEVVMLVEFAHRGQPLARVEFADNVTWHIDTWVDVAFDDKNCSQIVVEAFTIPGDRLFVRQRAAQALCEGDTSEACKTRELTRKSSWQSFPCPTLDNLSLNPSLSALGEDHYVLQGSSEGYVDATVFKWLEGDRFEPVLDHITGSVKVGEDKEVVIHSACNPLTGVSLKRYSARSCGTPSAFCGDCDYLYTDAVEWTWRPGKAPRIKQK